MTMICGDENSDWYDYDDGVATVDGDDDGEIVVNVEPLTDE